jgi:hypothetical protein
MKKENQMCTADNLKVGDLFMKLGKRKFHEVKKIIELCGKLIPDYHQGCLLIITEDCKQMVMPKNGAVEIFVQCVEL